MMKFIFILFTLLISLFAVSQGAQRGKDKHNEKQLLFDQREMQKNWLII